MAWRRLLVRQDVRGPTRKLIRHRRRIPVEPLWLATTAAKLRGISPTEETSVDCGRNHDSSVRVTIAGVVVGLGYAWVAADVRTFTRPAEVLTGVPIVVVGVMLVRGRRKGRRPT